ncbi:MAG: hypothetical protein IJL92_03425, partial [Thermoguttaceae bacterium]|nr:hypothetical protein [Thermoguttaceae bacterium]
AGADEASYMEIFAFVRDELHTTLNKARLALSVNDFMSRVSVNVFVADRFVRFDVDRIDARIERILHEAGTEYLALKGFADKLADFPSCGHEWNLFVLETFVRRFSEKFRLLTHEPNSVNVGIVVKRSSTLTTERQILRDAIVRASVPADVDQIHAWLVEKGYRFKRDEELLAELADCCASLGVLPPNAAPTDADRSFHDDATTPVSESVEAENKDDLSNWNKDETEEEDSENSSEATDDDEEKGDDENDEDNEDKDDISDWVFGGVPLEKILFRTRVGYGELASLNGAEPKVIEHNSEAMLKVLKELESCAPQCVVHQDFSYVEYKPGVWNDLKASVESRSKGLAESVKGSYTLMTRPYVATEIADRILTADRYVLEECVSAPIVVQEALILIDLYEEVDKMERLAPKKKELLRDALAYSTTLMAAVYFLATTYPTLGVFKGAILRIKEYLSQEYWDKVWSCQRYYASRAYTKWKVGEWRQRVSRALSSGVGTVRTLLVNPAVDVYDVVYNTALQRVYESGDVQAECDGSLMLRSLCRSRRRDPSADALFEYGRCFLYGIGFTSSLYRRKPENCKRIGFRRVRQAARRRCARARRLALELALTQDDCRGWAKKLLWKRALKDKKDALAILARYYAVEDANAQ